MDEKEQFDALIKLAEFKMEHRKERRQHEFRVSLTVWAALGAGIVAFKEHRLPICILVVSLAILVLLHASFWIWPHNKRNLRDTDRAYEYIKKAENLLSIPNLPVQPHGWFDFPLLFQIFTTLALAIAWVAINFLAPLK